MKKIMILVNIFTVFLLVMLSSVSAAECNTLIISNKSHIFEPSKVIDINNLIEKIKDNNHLFSHLIPGFIIVFVLSCLYSIFLDFLFFFIDGNHGYE